MVIEQREATMALTTYDPASTMREARATYFAVNGFGESGGYDDAWVDFKLGPVPFPFPNTASRIEAVRFHDLHHILTGYDTDFLGETEISAWELGAGCRGAAAWALNLAGLGGGALLAPRRTMRAFVRGLRSESFYGQDLDALLDLTVAEARARMRVDEAASASPTPSEVGRFAALAVVGFGAGAAFVAAGVLLAPVGLALSAVRRRGEAAAARRAGDAQAA
jgi:hypothetical protein